MEYSQLVSLSIIVVCSVLLREMRDTSAVTIRSMRPDSAACIIATSPGRSPMVSPDVWSVNTSISSRSPNWRAINARACSIWRSKVCAWPNADALRVVAEELRAATRHRAVDAAVVDREAAASPAALRDRLPRHYCVPRDRIGHTIHADLTAPASGRARRAAIRGRLAAIAAAIRCSNPMQIFRSIVSIPHRYLRADNNQFERILLQLSA